MARLISMGLLLAFGAALGACTGSNHNYSTASGNTGGSSAAPGSAMPATYRPPAYPASANGANNPAVSFEGTGANRQAIDAAANNYCATQGKVAAFSGRNGSRLSYDCIPGNAHATAAARPNYGNGASNPAISYDATLYDRQTLDAQAAAYCGTVGKTAAFSGRTGSRVSYDCVPYSDGAQAAVPAAAPASAPTMPSVTYQLTGGNRQAIETDAAAYCSAQGRVAQFHSQDAYNVTYDCVTGLNQPYTTAVYTYSAAAPTPVSVPVISYELASDGRGNLDAPAIRYCGMLGKTPVLRSQDGRRVTYECQ